MLLFLRVIIYGALLTLWFLVSYIAFDWIDGGEAKLDSSSTVEGVMATLANYDSTRFLSRLPRVYSKKSSMFGAIDLIQRLPDGRVQMAGWALDKAEAGQVTVFLIIPTKGVLVTSTGKRRDDVSTAFRLTKDFDSSGFDDVFEFQFDCKYNEKKPFAIAINQKKQFTMIKYEKKVSGCDNPGANQSATGTR